jgi:hypothetical protein
VGGERGGALVVRVSARAVDGQATEAALAAQRWCQRAWRNHIPMIPASPGRLSR